MSNDTDKKETRLNKAAEKFSDNLKVKRPGFGNFSFQPEDEKNKPEKQKSVKVSQTRIDLSEILWLEAESLRENPYNDYPPLSEEETVELAGDIREKGVIVPLIVRMDEDVIICGHNRRRASILAEEKRIPVQRVLRRLTEQQERELMKSENDRRRGGHWSKEKKEEFIQEHFGEDLTEDRRGGNFGNQYTGGKSSVNFRQDSQGSLAKEIEKKSRGKITEGTAKRIIAGIKKKPSSSVEKRNPRISDKDRKKGEKLALQLNTLRKTRDILENKLKKAKEEEKRLLKELKNIGQPELFGV